jgi:nucleoid-associated protein YgaU
MEIGYLGNITFSTSDKKILSFHEFKLSASGSWGEHKRTGQKSQWEFLGPESEKVSFVIDLDANFGISPRREIEKLMEYAESGTMSKLVIGGKKIGNQWRVINLSSSWDNIMSQGELVKASATLTIEECEDIVTLQSSKTNRTVAAGRTAQSQAASIVTYTVVKGDNLWNIAKKYYGNGSKYTLIYNANKGIIKSPSLIYPGQVLTIPAA